MHTVTGWVRKVTGHGGEGRGQGHREHEREAEVTPGKDARLVRVRVWCVFGICALRVHSICARGVHGVCVA